MMMMVLCPKAGSLAVTPPGDEMSEVISRCLPHRQLWVSKLSNVVTQWLEVDSNLQPSGHIYPYTTASCTPQRLRIGIYLIVINISERSTVMVCVATRRH